MTEPTPFPDAPRPDVSQILQAVRSGDPDAPSRLAGAVYDELRAMAKKRIDGLPPGATLQATALVHEAWMRIDGSDDWQSRAHFFGAAARAMRNVLVDHARARGRDKRGAGIDRVTLSDELASVAGASLDLLALDEALTRLQALDPRRSEVVLLRYFAGLGVDETARALGIAPATVDRDWNFARAWLRRELSRG